MQSKPIGIAGHESRKTKAFSQRQGSRTALFRNLALTLPFMLLYWLDLWHHQFWVDEVNAWSIAAASPNLATLLHYVHYEAHPWLWYVLLWLPSRLSKDPFTMKWVQALVGSGIYLVVGLASPFTRMQKVLVFLSYFVVFEYSVMSRMYGLMFLFALLYVWSCVRRPHAVLLHATLLGLLCSTDMTGVLLAFALLAEYAYTMSRARTASDHATPSPLRTGLALLIFAALLGVSIYSTLPARDISWQTSNRIGLQALVGRHVLRAVANLAAAPWWPISVEFPKRFWLTDAHDQKWLLPLAPIALVACWAAFRRRKPQLLILALTLLFGMLFADIVYIGHVRNWGIVFIAFLLCLWMQSAGEADRHWSKWAYGLMGVSVLAGVLATVSSWTHPFSQAKVTADWLKKNEPQQVPVIGYPDVTFVSVVSYLQHPVYFMECACMGQFKLFSRDRDDFGDEELPRRMILAQKNLNVSQFFFVDFKPLEAWQVKALQQSSLHPEELAHFTGADAWLENYHIYRVTKRP